MPRKRRRSNTTRADKANADKGRRSEAGLHYADYEDPAAQSFEEERRLAESGRAKGRLAAALASSALLLYVSMGHMPPAALPLPRFIDMEAAPLGYALVQLVLAAAVLAAGRDFYVSGFKSLLRLTPNMDALVAIGTGSAFVYSCYALIRIAFGSAGFVHNLFFESSAVVVALVMLGKRLEAGSKAKTSDAIRRLTRLAPDRALIEKDGARIEVEASELAVGDTVVVLPGGRFPCDGEVASGISTADNSMLTGESLPVVLESGSRVTGGAINGEGMIRFRATEVGGDTALSHIIRMVRDAQGKKAPIAKIADRVAAYFVPAVMAIAVVSAAAWLMAGKDIEFALNTFVSVLVIACPCALGLATPTAIMVGTGRAAQLGVLFKSGEALQAASGLTHIALDKPGTITEGKPTLIAIEAAQGLTEDELLSLAASLERGSEHPVAKAILREAEVRGVGLRSLEGISALPGRGVEAEVDGTRVCVGSERLMRERGVDVSPMAVKAAELLSRGAMLMYCAAGDRLLGLFAASDSIKPESAGAVARLVSMGLKVTMLTGDGETAAGAIAGAAGIASYIAGVLPSAGRGRGEASRLGRKSHGSDA